MSFKKIKELRQAGKLDEALQMANQALANEPENIWNKRAAAWVYYEYIKKNTHPDAFETFKENLIKIRDLQLPEDEKMVFDNCAWQIGSLIYCLLKSEHVDYSKINEVFAIIKEFHFSKPSEAYSFIYKAFHKGHQSWQGYIIFADWWDFENLRAEDYLREEFNGQKIMALAEQAYLGYAKKLLEGEPIDQFGFQSKLDREKIQSFLPKLDKLIAEHPDYQYPPYFKAKLLLALGSEENVLSAFLPFAKQKRNDFWVWEMLAEIFSKDNHLKFACYCKALSLKTPEDFLVKLRLSFAEMLIERHMYDEAKTEIEKVIFIREKHEWKLTNQISNWREQDWYKSANSKKSNSDLYAIHSKEAEQILFQDIPEELVVVEFVNEGKSMLNFVMNKQKFGFFNFKNHLTKPQIGDLLTVRFAGEGIDGFYKVLSVKKVESKAISGLLKSCEGPLKVVAPQNFGFVDDIFVEPQLVEKKILTDGQIVSVNAVLSFNNKKKEWGWKAFNISPNPSPEE